MNTQHSSPAIAKTTVLAVVVGLIVNIIIATLAQPLAPTLMQLTPMPVAFWTVLGIVGAALVFRRMLRNPEGIEDRFKRVALIVLLISFIPDILIYFVEVPGFTGTTLAGVIALMVLHVTTAIIAVRFLLRSVR
jgi:hypothetical protein